LKDGNGIRHKAGVGNSRRGPRVGGPAMRMLAAGLLLWAPGLSADTHYAGGTELGVYPYVTPETAAFYLQDAVDAAEPGDTVAALPRLYLTPEAQLVMGPGVALRGSGPEETVILGDVRVADGVRISGFTFVNCALFAWDFPACDPLRWCVSDCVMDGASIGGIPGCWTDELTVRRCVFRNMWRRTAISAFQYKVSVSDCRFEMDSGASVVAINVSDSLTVCNCLFTGCSSAVYCFEGTTDIKNSIFLGNDRGVEVIVARLSIDSCTFFGNRHAIWTTDQCDWGPTLRNCILWGSTEANVFIERSHGFGVPQISFSDVEGGYPGRGNIDADPMFFLPSAREPDLHLCAFSPCVDAGDPFSDYGNEPEPNGGTINMGAYGNTREATTSELVDTDMDDLRDDWEMDHFGTLDADGSGDADYDGLVDRDEYRHLSDPNNPDSDGDGLLDGEEVMDFATDPILPDTDNDGTPDGKEVSQGTDPLDPWDAFVIIKFWIENNQMHVVHPVQPGHWYCLEYSYRPKPHDWGWLASWRSPQGITSHTFVLECPPHLFSWYKGFFRVSAKPYP
jgi:hypothetical protein